MKRLILFRHAKAEKRSSEIDDFERRLTKKGNKNAKEVSEYVGKILKKVDLIVTSPAVRAKETAEIFSKYSNSKAKLFEEELLYGGEVEEIIERLSEILKGYNNVVIVGHNPTLEELLQKLTGNDTHLRKAGAVCIEGDSFDDILSGKGKIKWMVDPKSLEF
ncbi:phosphoglycerate mutase [Petrotoga sp. 9PWA.NaAc.5.4]|nr:phosphoglycerate mutase [Petrotoga sp. 9PWA.NaAc.5.4]